MVAKEIRWVSALCLAASLVLGVTFQAPAACAQSTNVTEAEAKMFAASAGYERFMGRWSRLLAPLYISFAGVKDGDRVLDVGTGTGSAAAAVEARMPKSEIVGIDPSAGFIAYAQKNAKSTRARFEVGDGQALKFKDGSFDQTLALLVMNFISRPSSGRGLQMCIGMSRLSPSCWLSRWTSATRLWRPPHNRSER
jgi:SAM-dependent methyltransferase